MKTLPPFAETRTGSGNAVVVGAVAETDGAALVAVTALAVGKLVVGAKEDGEGPGGREVTSCTARRRGLAQAETDSASRMKAETTASLARGARAR